MEAVSGNLEKYRKSGIPLGLCIGKNEDIPNEDAPRVHAIVAEWFYGLASYFAINVSSPNTPGLRDLQDKKPLTDIVQAVNGVMDAKGARKPLFVKIAPELTETAVDDVIEVVIDNGLTGIIAVNTTNSDEVKKDFGKEGEDGGISGDNPKYREMATRKISHIRKVTGGNINIIGVGGIKDADTALEKIMSGADLIQVVTAIRGEGPAVAGKITRGIVEFMEREGVESVTDLVGVRVKKSENPAPHKF